jgi:phytanoyl-CoA hydroxylase
MPIPSLVRRAIPSALKRRVREFLAPRRIRNWHNDSARIPWFDRPDALELLENRRRQENLTDADCELLTCWATEGYCVAHGIIAAELIDSMLMGLDDLWTADHSFDGLEFCDLRFGHDPPRPKIPHRDLLKLNPVERLQARTQSNWRTHSFQTYSAAANAIFHHSELTRLASLILSTAAVPQGSINFEYGSAQDAHQDTAVFHVFPANHIVGAWIACEDISSDCGPLMFYPQSHRESLFSKFDNYPQTNLRTATPAVAQAYHAHVKKLTSKYERQLFLPGKGDVFLWHGMMLHGGSEIKNPALTRKSCVIHYMPKGANVADRMVGPFNW